MNVIASKEVSSLKLTVHVFRGGPHWCQPFDKLENVHAVDGRKTLYAQMTKFILIRRRQAILNLHKVNIYLVRRLW